MYPCKVHFNFNEIREISSSVIVSFSYVVGSTNYMADALAKQGIVRLCNWMWEWYIALVLFPSPFFFFFFFCLFSLFVPPF